METDSYSKKCKSFRDTLTCSVMAISQGTIIIIIIIIIIFIFINII